MFTIISIQTNSSITVSWFTPSNATAAETAAYNTIVRDVIALACPTRNLCPTELDALRVVQINWNRLSYTLPENNQTIVSNRTRVHNLSDAKMHLWFIRTCHLPLIWSILTIPGWVLLFYARTLPFTTTIRLQTWDLWGPSLVSSSAFTLNAMTRKYLNIQFCSIGIRGPNNMRQVFNNPSATVNAAFLRKELTGRLPMVSTCTTFFRWTNADSLLFWWSVLDSMWSGFSNRHSIYHTISNRKFKRCSVSIWTPLSISIWSSPL